MFEKCQAGIGRIKSVSMLLAHVITFWIPPTFDLHSFVIAVNFLLKIHKNSCSFFKHGLAHDSTTIRNLMTIRNTEKLVKQNLKQKNWLPLSRQDWEKCLKDAFILGWRPPSIWRPNTRTKPDLTPHAGRHQPKRQLQPISGLRRLAAADHSKPKTQHTTCARWVRPQEEERAKLKAGESFVPGHRVWIALEINIHEKVGSMRVTFFLVHLFSIFEDRCCVPDTWLKQPHLSPTTPPVLF